MYIDRSKLVAEMTRQNMTCTELCEKCGFSRNVTTKLRNRGGPCAEKTLQKICDVLGIRIVDLIDDETAWNAYEAKLKEAEAIKPRNMPVELMNVKSTQSSQNPISNIEIRT